MSIEIRHAEAEVNGVRLHYAAAGAGSLVMFVHGFPEFWYEWRRQLVEFGRDHLAVAPDMRGYNLLSRPSDLDEYAVPKLVEDIRALADTWGTGDSRWWLTTGVERWRGSSPCCIPACSSAWC